MVTSNKEKNIIRKHWITFNNLEEIEEFLENFRPAEFTYSEMDNLNSPTAVKETGSSLKTSENKIT